MFHLFLLILGFLVTSGLYFHYRYNEDRTVLHSVAMVSLMSLNSLGVAGGIAYLFKTHVQNPAIGCHRSIAAVDPPPAANIFLVDHHRESNHYHILMQDFDNDYSTYDDDS